MTKSATFTDESDVLSPQDMPQTDRSHCAEAATHLGAATQSTLASRDRHRLGLPSPVRAPHGRELLRHPPKVQPQVSPSYSQPADKSGSIRCDQIIVLSGAHSVHAYPQRPCDTKYHDAQIGKTFNSPSNDFAIPAQVLCRFLGALNFSRCPNGQLGAAVAKIREADRFQASSSPTSLHLFAACRNRQPVNHQHDATQTGGE